MIEPTDLRQREIERLHDALRAVLVQKANRDFAALARLVDVVILDVFTPLVAAVAQAFEDIGQLITDAIDRDRARRAKPVVLDDPPELPSHA